MRISDWSSDVCSSDLHTVFTTRATGSLAGSQIRHDAWRHEPDHALGERDVESASLSGCSPPVQRRQNGHGSITPSQHVGRRCADFLRFRFARPSQRSEEHTSEPQSLMRNSYDVFCLKKKKQIQRTETR